LEFQNARDMQECVRVAENTREALSLPTETESIVARGKVHSEVSVAVSVPKVEKKLTWTKRKAQV
jgi:hypothetical protein